MVEEKRLTGSLLGSQGWPGRASLKLPKPLDYAAFEQISLDAGARQRHNSLPLLFVFVLAPVVPPGQTLAKPVQKFSLFGGVCEGQTIYSLPIRRVLPGDESLALG
jgi:hypothetical protein